jgi:hypothetical protein
MPGVRQTRTASQESQPLVTHSDLTQQEEVILIPAETKPARKSPQSRAELAKRYFAIRQGLRKVSRYFNSCPLIYCRGDATILSTIEMDKEPDLWVAVPTENNAKLYAFYLPDQLHFIQAFSYPKILSIMASNRGSLFLP